MCRHQPMRMILNPSSKGERVSGGIQCLLTGEQLYERRMLSVMPSNRNTVIMVFRQSGLTIQLYCLTVIRLARIRFDNRAIGRTRLRMTFNFLESKLQDPGDHIMAQKTQKIYWPIDSL